MILGYYFLFLNYLIDFHLMLMHLKLKNMKNHCASYDVDVFGTHIYEKKHWCSFDFNVFGAQKHEQKLP